LSSNDGKHFEKIFSEQNTKVRKKFERKRRKYFGGIFRVSSTDAMSSDSRVGGDCEAGRRDHGGLGIRGEVADNGAATVLCDTTR
jgi:hypothetical protein